MQLQYNLAPIPGVPGQLLDLNSVGLGDIVSCVAGEIIPPGIDCEMDSTGKARAVKDAAASWPPPGTAAGTTHLGVSIFDLAGYENTYTTFSVPRTTAGSTSTGYPKGAVVPFLRKGRIWMAYDGGGTPVRIGVGNIWHSSDGTHLQGVVTFTAVSATVGAEIDLMLAGMTVWNPTLLAGSYTDSFGVSASVCAVSLNLP